ncbi:MAG TPA: sigma 54-interacting transcriptional regulator [Polyangiaceae bacterium]|nr:sigma 54-interacting transcriptional regulator [Polyangiaceae bacterium]
MTTFALPFLGEVTIGSAEGSTVRLTEPSIAPLHAVLTTGSRMTVRDAGSGAPTVIGTRRLAPGETSPVSPGVIMLLGTVTLVVQATGASTRLRHVRSHDYFEGRLEDECARAEHSQGAFAVVRLRFTRNQAQALEEGFTRHLRPVDLVAMYASDEYELLLTDATRERAEEIAGWILEHVRAKGLGELTLGLATWPSDGRSPEALLAAAGAGVHGRSEQPTSRVSAGALEALQPLVERVAQASINVLILGETGVGKEVLARRIHELSPRASRPLLCVNCAALTETLLESELFGHERGAFTGAVQSKPGLLEVAEGGTVLLDELGEMPLSIQAKLLRVVETHSVTRVGGLKARIIDVRFMAATHRDLEAEIARSRFREDLYYRLNGVSLVVPPLRERKDEIAPLAQAFVSDFARQSARPAPKITTGALAVLERYAWPGNVRELRNMMERAVLLTPSDVIDLVHLPLERLGRMLPHERVSELPPLPGAPVARTSAAPPVTGMLPGRTSAPPPAGSAPGTYPAPGAAWSARPGTYSFTPAASSGPEAPLTAEIASAAGGGDERARIIGALERCGGNQTHAARLLGVSRRTLINRIQRYNLPRPRKRDEP